MSDIGGKLRCGECARLWAERKQADPKTTWQPACYTGPCTASEVMCEDLDPWIGLFNMLRVEFFQSSVPSILKRAKATDADMDVFMMLETEVNRWRDERAKRK